MKNIRVIPRIDIKGPNLVKGIHLEGLRVLGKPEDFARYYYEHGADELIYMDIVASLYGRNSLRDIIEKTAREIFIPFTVGGGIRTLEDIRAILRAGADKVSVNTAAIKDANMIREAARKFGSSTIVISIEAIKEPDGRYLAYTDCGREHTGIEIVAWAKKVEDLGAGEIFLTSVDKDGTGEGYDIELIRRVSETVSIPVIAYGGAGNCEDIVNVIKDGKADAVSMSSVLHYGVIGNKALDESSFQSEGNITYLKSGKVFSKIEPHTIESIKNSLKASGIMCRH
ncbi:MAG: imidazole glycerol phosphate synthase cyclase subunit [Candidatus Omnitrophica bacterium]|nr:imidazole glycerol phosphate synthase cyclase subunit [Candidatus Omnitrophota bacterium]